MTFIKKYLIETHKILSKLSDSDVELIVDYLSKIRNNNGRLFLLGVGGSASTVSHATNDFRKICKIESYCATDNVSELTALTNDIGWENTFCSWLEGSNLNDKDGIFICSVGGGNKEKNVSMNVIKAIDYAKSKNACVMGVVGRDGGYTKQKADACVIIPPLIPDKITPHTEGLASVIFHLLVTHPALKIGQTKWESVV